MMGEPPSCSGGCHDSSTKRGPMAKISGAFVGAGGFSVQRDANIEADSNDKSIHV